tara:strand:+ start:1565 stop:2308 length:744 start_codon:yes stop_codon:yes gene_type:complete
VKKFYFLSGYSRSGNTFLSSILNQNKNITVTPNSCVVEIMYDLFKMYESSWIKNLPEFSGLNNVTMKLLENYYEHIDSEFIFERGAWGTPYNLNMLQKLNYQPKFLLLVRPLVEVLASYVKVQKPKDVENFIYNVMHSDVGKIYFDWQSTSNIIKTNQNYLLIKYNDLVNNTEEKMKEIYNYFEIPEFKHRFENIEPFTYNGVKYNDSVFESPNLHKIKSEIKKDVYDVEEYLPKDIIKRYAGWDYF